MWRWLRWLGIGIGSLLGLVVLAAILIPILYKEEIHAKIKQEINKNLNATLNYTDLDLSLFRNFPYLTLELEGFSIVGKGTFAEDSLVALKRLDVAVNLMNVIRGEKITVRRVVLQSPRILLKTLADGRANYLDITLPDTTKPAPEDTTSAFTPVGLSRIAIRNGRVRVVDHSQKLYAGIDNLNFTGSGDLMNDQYDFSTQTTIDKLNVEFDKVKYARNLKVESDIDLFISEKNTKFQLKENRLKVNEFELRLDGFVQLREKETFTDLKLKTTQTKFSNILSLVPGIYTQSFASIQTDGQVGFDAWVQGSLTDTQTPAFYAKLKVADAYMKYADLPAPVKNIQVDLEVQNSTHILENTRVDLKRFHAELNTNPIDARVQAVGLTDPVYDGSVKARVNLEEITRIFPVETLTVKGQLVADAEFKGRASDTTLPKLKGMVDLKYGYLKSKDFAQAIENIALATTFENPTGRLQDLVVDLKNLHADFDGQPLDAILFFRNALQPEYKLNLKANLDLEKLLKVYPIEGMKLAGKLLANVATEGNMALIQNQQYAALPTTGTVQLRNFVYTGSALEYPVSIPTADLEFTNAYVSLTNFAAQIGASDFQMTGRLQNLIEYALAGKLLKGDLTLTSNLLNANQLMGTDTTTQKPADDAPLEAPQVPANIDFSFSTTIKKILYDTYTLDNFTGSVIVKDRTAQLTGLSFRTFGGLFRASAKYATPEKALPQAAMAFQVDSLDINKTYTQLEIAQKFLPIVKDVSGRVNVNMSMNLALKENLDPVYPSINGLGMFFITEGKAGKVAIMDKINEATKLNLFNDFYLKDTKLNFAIRDGRIFFDPFYVRSGEQVFSVKGSNGLDQTIDYEVGTDLPAARLAGPALGAINQLTGRNLPVPQNLRLDLQVGGTVTQPRITGVKMNGSGAADAKNALVDQAKAEAERKMRELQDKAKAEAEARMREAEARARAEAERAKAEAEARARAEAERAKAEAERKAREEADRLKREAEQKKAEAERKAKEEADRLKREAEQKLKDKLKFPR